MKKSLFLQWLPLAAAMMLVGACTQQEAVKTEYTHVIPANTTQVAAIYLTDLAQKAGLGSAENLALEQQLFTLLMEGSSSDFSQKLRNILENPSEAGIDWNAPAYLFNVSSLHGSALTFKISDLQKFEELIKLLSQERLSSEPIQAEGYTAVEIEDVGLLLAYNDGTLLVVYGDGTASLQKLRPALTDLMKQSADKSIHSNPYFALMMQQKGDIRILATPDAIPLDLKSILNWPVGTQLLGYTLFENGRIYATLQRADFQGKTAESNQPFHPKNSSELQQSVAAIRSGVPFNIMLTNEELLTLSNVGLLMQLVPSPEIEALYQAIMQVETLNLRGDGNQTNFTLVLKDSRRNALKQILDFATSFWGDFIQTLDF